MFSATFFDGEGWREGAVGLIDGRMLVRDDHATTGLPRLDGVVTEPMPHAQAQHL